MGILLETDVVLRDPWTGAAWLSSARALRCSLKWGNERNPHHVLDMSHETALPYFSEIFRENKAGRKERMTSNQHGPLTPRAALALQWLGQWDAKSQDGANPLNLASVQIGG